MMKAVWVFWAVTLSISLPAILATVPGPSAEAPAIRLDWLEVTGEDGVRQKVDPQPNLELGSTVRRIRLHWRLETEPGSEARGPVVRLAGFETDFEPTTHGFQRDYTHLPPGHYRFQAAFPTEGPAPRIHTLVSFRIPHPFWFSPLFLVFVFAVLATGIYFFLQLRGRALAGENRRLRRELTTRNHELERKKMLMARLAITDELTGLYNRRFILNLLEKELRRLCRARPGECLAVLLTDLDQMQQINRTWGIKTGDVLLQHVARCLKTCLRSTDTCARVGGQQFLVLLPQTEKRGAARVAEKIRQTMMFNVMENEGKSVRFSVSLGGAVACSPRQFTADLIEEIQHHAEFMLRGAKESGRNRFQISDLPEP
ncbi:MAG: GGDEF domain-containing protein [Acidobacteria bacterium]|nr:GGDEF domain-containing protein [Acidobacteriota bacterium]